MKAHTGQRMEDWPVAILAGGLATRLRPITERTPKALVRVAGKPFLEHQLRLLRTHGFENVVLCVGHRGEMIQEEFGSGAQLGVRIQYSADGPTLLGTGGALKRAVSLLGEQFVVLYGDSYLMFDYRAAAESFAKSGRPALMTVFRNEGRWDRSNVVFRDGRVARYDKREASPDMHYIDYGASLLRVSALERIPPDEPHDLADLFHALADEGRLAGYEVTQRFYEIGSPDGLRETERYLQEVGLAAAPVEATAPTEPTGHQRRQSPADSGG